MRLQQQYLAVQAKIDRAYEDRLAGRVSDDARLLKMLLSNCSFDRGSLSVSWVKPFDLLARGNENGDWLGVRDALWNWLVTAA
jgi:hypothetical protein